MHNFDPASTTATISLSWWPPLDEEVGDDRADELIDELRRVAGPVVDDAERDLRSRLDAGDEVVRGPARKRFIAGFRFDDPLVRFLCVGTVYQAKGNPGEMNSIQLDRDGVLRWRRE